MRGLKVFWWKRGRPREDGEGQSVPEFLHNPAAPVFVALKLQGRVPYAELFRPAINFCLDLFEPPGIGLAVLAMGIENVDIRTEGPEMDIMDPVNAAYRFNLPFHLIRIDIAGCELEKDQKCVPEERE